MDMPIWQGDMKKGVSQTPSFYTEQKDKKNIKTVLFSKNGVNPAVQLRKNFCTEPEPENLKKTLAQLTVVKAPLKIPKNLIKFSTGNEKDMDSGEHTGSTKSNSNKNSNRKSRRKIIRKVYIQQNQKLIEQRV